MTRKRKISFVLVAVTTLLVAGLYVSLTRLSSTDCTSTETYDVVTGSCYYDCISDQDCANKAAKVDAELNQYFAGSKTKIVSQNQGQASPKTPTTSNTTRVLTKDYTGSDTDGTIYTVTGQQSLIPNPNASDNQLWEFFSKVAGKSSVTKYIQSFEVFDDADNDSAASVWQSQSMGKWHVNVNAAYTNDTKDLIHTMVHEYGHIVSLNSSQINGAVQGSCPSLALSEGCANQNSYITRFYDRFWQQFGSNVPANEGQDQDEVADFYNSNSSEFISGYAASNYIEDWAETWATFVTRAKPSGNRIKDKKVQSLYDSTALVNERNRIRIQIAKSI